MLLVISITLVYCALIGTILIGIENVDRIKDEPADVFTSFSILIPFRDEAANLPELIASFKKLDYPKDNFELIFINDQSRDNSTEIINREFEGTSFQYMVLDMVRTSLSPKKDAIRTAIARAKFDRVVTTDADCMVPEKWLNLFNYAIQKQHAAFIAGPVSYRYQPTFLQQFQTLELLSLQGVTMGAFGLQKPIMCNGANLCFSKEIFHAVNGYEGNDRIASGDDIFLLEKVARQYPDKLMYLKSYDAIVWSKPEPALKELIQQRIRWAAKSTAVNNLFNKLVALSVIGMNTVLILLLLAALFGYANRTLLLGIFLLKFFVDGILLLKTTLFFRQQKAMFAYILSSLVYPFFSMFVAIASLAKGYHWKGRFFKK